MVKPVESDLFAAVSKTPSREDVAAGCVVLRAFVVGDAAVVAAVADVVAQAPLRHMTTPSGTMSVAMTNCGRRGWTADAGGYAYTTADPTTTAPWPPLPAPLQALATSAAQAAGYPDFLPDACLINQYLPGASMGLHQDKNERDRSAPIVSVSLGLPAVFLWGGATRAAPVQKLRLEHGDVVVFGGPARLCFHGVAALKDGVHPLLGRRRLNLTFRRAG